jgi:hypothetical protein
MKEMKMGWTEVQSVGGDGSPAYMVREEPATHAHLVTVGLAKTSTDCIICGQRFVIPVHLRRAWEDPGIPSHEEAILTEVECRVCHLTWGAIVPDGFDVKNAICGECERK